MRPSAWQKLNTERRLRVLELQALIERGKMKNMDQRDYAARAAAEAFAVPWDELTEVQKDNWRTAARKAQGATPAPFAIDMSIKVPGQEYNGVNRHWRCYFGSSDEEIEKAGQDFIEMMKGIRDNRTL